MRSKQSQLKHDLASYRMEGFHLKLFIEKKRCVAFLLRRNGLFVVIMFNQSGLGYNAEQINSRGTNGKGKLVAESETGAVPSRAKSGLIEHNNNIIVIDSDSEESRHPVKERKQTPPENREIYDGSANSFTQLSNDADMSSSRSVANASKGPSRGNIAKEKDVSVELGRANEVASDTEDESWSSDSVYEILAQPRLPREVISISSGSFHDNVDGVKSQCSPNLRVKTEPDNSENSDSDQATTKRHAKLRFASCQKPISNKQKSSTASDQAAQFRSRNPYFAKQMVESNVRGARCMNVFVKFATEYFPAKHSKITLLLPQENRRWRVKCGYSCQTPPQWYFYAGWSDFAHDINLEVSTWCVFELTDKKRREMTVHNFK